MKKIVIIGGGRITTALLAGWKLAHFKPSILVHDRNPGKLRQLKKTYGVQTDNDVTRAIEGAHLLIVAVRPSSVMDLLRTISPIKVKLNALSLAAGIPIAKLRRQMGPPLQWARAMPSPASRTGHGLAALTFDRGFSQSVRREVITLFLTVGDVIEIPDSQFDAFTATHSTSHGYHALATLASTARGAGLDRKTALVAAAHALADGIAAWRQSGLDLDSLLEEAATPGGIAAATMKAMDESGYKRALTRGLAAGIRRARANARLR